MSFVSYARSILHALNRALHFAHICCKASAYVGTWIERSNASDELKARVASWITETNGVCDAIQAWEDALPGE